MDHILFLVQNQLETAQVSLRSFSGHIGSSLSSIKDESKNVLVKYVNKLKITGYSTKFHSVVEKFKDLWYSFKVVDLYDRCLYFFLTEVTRTHIYFGGMCFIFGAVIGIGMGIRIRDHVVTPPKMRAVVANSYRGLESINVVEDIVAPRIVSPDQVLIQVKAVGIDYIDVKIAEGYGRVMRRHLNKYNPNNWGELPVILGRDCSGVVVAIGREVANFQQGDEVWLSVPIHHQGTLSEYIVVSEHFVALKPSQLTHECAATLPYDVMKAWDALVNQAGLDEFSTAGKRILIHAGVCGVGVVAIQLARTWGAHVTTTVNSVARPLAHLLGADDVITYDTTNFEKELLVREKYDVIFNPIGSGASEVNMLEVCAPGGVIVTSRNPKYPSDSYGFLFGILYGIFIRIKYSLQKKPWINGGKFGTLEISGDVLDKVAPLIASGQLQPVVDKAYSAQDAEVAFHHITSGETIGKTVLRFSLTTPIRNLGMAFWQDL